MIAEGNNINEAWEKSILLLLNHGQFVPTERGKFAIEINNINIIINNPSSKTEVSNKYIFSKTFIHNYCESIMNSYGRKDSINKRIYDYRDTKLNQVDKVIEILKNDWFSRRAVITVWDPIGDLSSSYPPCICSLTLFIRNNKLNMTSMLRSNDAWLAAIPDIYSLVIIQEYIAKHLKIEIGYYHQISISYHIYEYDIPMIKQLFKKGNS